MKFIRFQVLGSNNKNLNMEISLGCSIEIDLFIHTYITFLYVPNSRNSFELINFHIGGLLLSSNSSRHTTSHIDYYT